MSETNSSDEKQNLYLGWLLAAKLAEWLGMDVGMKSDGDTIIFIIELPSGPVGIQIPRQSAFGKWKEYKKSIVALELSTEQTHEAIMDCLYGVLVSKLVLMIPEKKDETE